MRLFVPYTIAHPPTVALAVLCGGTMVPMDAGDGYVRYLEERWSEGEPFVNLEHDVEASPAQLDELWECPSEWCGFGAVMAGGDMAHSGGSVSFCAVKFSTVFLNKTSRVWVDLREFFAGRFPTGDGRWRWDGRQWPWSLASDWLPYWIDRWGPGGLEPHKHGPPPVVNARPHQ